MNPVIYSFSQFHEIQTVHSAWENLGDGYQLNIHDVENLSITGLGDELVKIHIEPAGAYVEESMIRRRSINRKPGNFLKLLAESHL